MDASPTTEPFRFTADVASGLRGDFAAAGFSRNADPLVLETKREIRRLLDSVAALCHSRVAPRQFWPRFLADVGAALAADGGVVWQRRGSQWIAVASHGAVDHRLVEAGTATESAAPSPPPGNRQQAPDSADRESHAAMVHEIGRGGEPVIVPPSGTRLRKAGGDADDVAAGDEGSIEPGNPTDQLAAVIPIPVDPDEPIEWMYELFLPLGGGPGTHRGYLRFAAQMGDLAADYLRRERYRKTRRRADQAARLHEAFADLHGIENRSLTERLIVDQAARLFAADRVSLVLCRRNGSAVRAVSGVDQIDASMAAVQMIRNVADETSGEAGFVPAEAARQSSAHSGTELPHRPTAEPDPKPVGPAADDDASDGSLMLRGVAIIDSDQPWKLVVEDRHPTAVDAEQLRAWTLFVTHAAVVLRQSPGAGRGGWLGWIVAGQPTSGSQWGRPLRWSLAVAAVLLIAAVPVPLVVTADARLEPRQVQMVYAPRDSVVAEVLVAHGSEVMPGAPLLRLVDSDLDRSISALLGRRAVLSERSAELRERLISRAAGEAEEAERLQTEQRITAEELRSIDAELGLLEEQRGGLVLRSDRRGSVDAWQIRDRLANRPVRRGQSLLRVVAPEGGWLIEAEVPQNRLDHVLAAQASGGARADVVLTAFPDRTIAARLESIGPATTRAAAGAALASTAAAESPTGIVTFGLDPSKLPLLQPGAPAQVGIECGYRPLAYVACQDLVRTLVGAVRLYW